MIVFTRADRPQKCLHALDLLNQNKYRFKFSNEILHVHVHVTEVAVHENLNASVSYKSNKHGPFMDFKL